MSVSIRLKHSATKDKAPLPTDLGDGELALNTNAASPAAYIKDSAGAVVKLAGVGGVATPDASETVKGIAEIATQAEVTAGTDDSRIVTPKKLAAAVPAASETVAGKVELATAAETTTGTDDTRAVHPAGLKVELDKKVDLAGDTMTGNLTVPSLNTGQLAGFRNVLINGNLTINQRGVDIAAVATGSYGQDRWKKTAGGMTQIIEEGNFEPGATYTLSGTGIATQQLTAPASGNWTLPDIPVTARKIQLEPGPVATSFELRPVGTELALCQRYFQRIKNNPTQSIIDPQWTGFRGVASTWSGAVTNHGNIHVPLYMPVRGNNPTLSIVGSRVKDLDNIGDNFNPNNPYGSSGGGKSGYAFIGFAYSSLPSNYVIDFNYVDVDAEF